MANCAAAPLMGTHMKVPAVKLSRSFLENIVRELRIEC
jgi:hypothetical protein